ncbi:MAG: hypothetical protein WC479_10135 [Candidatus Izemoplasmatales bacterium]|jgi:hypothetical protein
MDNQACVNTDKTLWQKEGIGRIFITEQDGLGIEVGGRVFVKPIKDWHNFSLCNPINEIFKDIRLIRSTAQALVDTCDETTKKILKKELL